MSHTNHEAVKRVLRREFGIEGIDGPDELQELLRLKMDGMNAMDRAAVEMQLGQAAREIEHGRRPSRIARIVAFSIIMGILWVVWPPLVIVGIVYPLAGWLRRFAIQNALFWTPTAAAIVGASYGILLMIIVRFASVWTVNSTIGSVGFGIFGFLAAGYIGYGAQRRSLCRDPGDEKRSIASAVSVTSYLLSLGAWIGLARLLH